MKNFFYLFAAAMVCPAGTLSAQDGAVGVIINGVTWATRNVGVKGKFMDYPSDYGLLYTFEEAQEACPEGWRPPTRDEFEVLAQAPNELVEVNNVNGRRFGSGDNTIFLPAAGYRSSSGGPGNGQGSLGYYWSSTALSSLNGYNLYFLGSSVEPSNSHLDSFRFAIRCVRE